MREKIKLILLLLILGIISASGQVTIGSGIEPNAGMLLDLKETSDQGVNSTKGLMLPRVNLTNMSNLYPMFLGDAAYTGAAKTAQDDLHIGLMVYNTNQCVSADGRGKGVYSWTGTQWALINPLSPLSLGATTTQYIDQDAQPFYASKFGDAGEWMTQNLRVKRYSDDLTALPSTALDAAQAKKWGYPSTTGTGTTDASLYNQDAKIGLVYNINALLRSDALITGADEGDNGSVALKQGGLSLCPQGWHLPSDIEWNELEKAIADLPSSYSTLATATVWNTAWNTSFGAGTQRGTHGEAMKAACLPIPFAASAGGKSFAVEQGGFNAILLQGTPAAVHSVGYWTASKTAVNNTAWTRYLSQDTPTEATINKTVERRTSAASDMYAVRCKKTTVFAVCGDPVTDAEGNMYNTANYGTAAGCWMTSNLKTTKIGGTTLPLDANAANTDVAVYAIPNKGTGAVSEDGYLYTWRAATATGIADETLMPGDTSSKSNLQGICPSGWVLPSDLDWTLLEQEINSNPIPYSSLTASSITWDASYASTDGWRPTPGNKTIGWGQSFKASVTINGLTNTLPALSSDLAKGFKLRLVGLMDAGNVHSFGSVGNVWTSSAVFTSVGIDDAAKYRGFSFDNSGVYRGNASKTSMLSVRCKLKP